MAKDNGNDELNRIAIVVRDEKLPSYPQAHLSGAGQDVVLRQVFYAHVRDVTTVLVDFNPSVRQCVSVRVDGTIDCGPASQTAKPSPSRFVFLFTAFSLI
jgi:hypothetical protein